MADGTYRLIVGIILILVGIGLLIWGIVEYNNRKNTTDGVPTWVWILIIGASLLIVIGLFLVIFGIIVKNKANSAAEVKNRALQVSELKKVTEAKRNLVLVNQNTGQPQGFIQPQPQICASCYSQVPITTRPNINNNLGSIYR
jgi:uncharacterized membrane protein